MSKATNEFLEFCEKDGNSKFAEKIKQKITIEKVKQQEEVNDTNG